MTPEQERDLATLRLVADDARDAAILETIRKMRAVLDEMEAAIYGKPRVVFFSNDSDVRCELSATEGGTP